MIVAPQDELVTRELYHPPTLASPWLVTLVHLDARVSSWRWQARRDSADGTVHRFVDGPVVRVRTEQLTPVPPLERSAHARIG